MLRKLMREASQIVTSLSGMEDLRTMTKTNLFSFLKITIRVTVDTYPVQPKRSDKSALGPHADLFTDIGPI